MTEAGATIQGAIAVIGLACRVPGASDRRALWRNLRAGIDSIAHFSREEALADGADAETVADPAFVPAGGILDEALAFDAAFFGYSPREALAMDPQQRALLECAWSALEDAGRLPETVQGHIGVFAGTTVSTYHLNMLMRAQAWRDRDAQSDAAYGNFPGFAATRISYKLNLTGPSLNVQTACSTSLVAVHLACQSLLNFECDLALAGGASIRLPQRAGYVHEPEGILSPDGRCRVFDRDANGTVFGNGVGVVVLKRLEDAIADGDRIDAVILGSAINNDGARKAGYTAPGVRGQADVIEAAQRVAGVDPGTIGYVEAHGTGTALGDPIEVRALSEVFRRRTAATGYCALGSLKGNVGHLDAAAGVCSLIKAIEVVRHGIVPPVPHFTAPNPRLEIDRSPFFVPAGEQDWPLTGAGPRLAAVSSFGFGGTNAHVVLRHWDAAPPAQDAAPAPQLIRLSADTRRGVDDLGSGMAAFDGWDATTTRAVAATLRDGRRARAHRRAIVAATPDEARASLSAAASGAETTTALTDPKRVFMFTGQGAQHAGMARALHARSPAFREALDRCAARLAPELGLDIRTLILAEGAGVEAASETLRRTRFTQPALFAVEYALTRWWASLGVVPDAMIGHSIGEYVAACCAGVFSLEDALRLVAVRGRLMDEMPPGAMLAVPLAADRLELAPGIEIAAINAPELTVVGGPAGAVDAFARTLAARGTEARRLRTSHAFHSAAMEGALDRFRDVLATVARNAPGCRIAGNLTGDWLTDEQARSVDYWVQQLRRPVLFSAGLQRILALGPSALIEIGPGATLATLARAHLAPAERQRAIATLPRPDDPTDDHRHALAAAGRFWSLGGVLTEQDAAGERTPPVSLPTYPFERRIYTVAPDRAEAGLQPGLRRRADIGSWTYVPGWASRPLPPRVPRPETWIIVALDDRLAERVATLARDLTEPPRCIHASPASSFARMSDARFHVPFDDHAGWASLLAAASPPGGGALRIVDLRHVAAPSSPPPGLEARLAADGASLRSGLFSLMQLGRALSERGDGVATSLIVVASAAASVLGDETIDPARSGLLALCRVLPAEIEGLNARMVDVDAHAGDSPDRLARRLVAEAAAGSDDSYVAWRGTRRWAFVPASIDLPATDGPPARLRRGGSYLITGGLGGIGLALARHLAEAGAACVVLAGRRALPPRDAWAGLLASDATDAGTIRAVQAIEAKGTRVVPLVADAADPDSVRNLLATARGSCGRIDGIVHAAGVAGGGVMAMQSEERMRRAMAAKTTGATVLIASTAEDPPDFLMLFSSLSALVGTAGRLDYAAANLFMDALATAARAQGRRDVVSVNWDLWMETGMARDLRTDGAAGTRLADAGTGLSEGEGIELFRRILAGDEPNVIVSVRDLPMLMRNVPAAPADGGEATAAAQDTGGGAGDAERRASAPYRAPETELETRIAGAWQQVLGVDRIGADDDFFELGGDSLLALRLAGRLRPILQQEVGPRSIMENPTIAALARAFAPRAPEVDRAAALRARIDSMSPEEIRAMLARKSAARTDR